MNQLHISLELLYFPTFLSFHLATLPHESYFPKGLHHYSTFWSSLIHPTFSYHCDVPCSVLDGYQHFGGTNCFLFEG